MNSVMSSGFLLLIPAKEITVLIRELRVLFSPDSILVSVGCSPTGDLLGFHGTCPGDLPVLWKPQGPL